MAVSCRYSSVAGNVGMQVNIVQMPKGGGDPDKFVKTFGIKSVRELARLDLFSWRMKEAVERGEDPVQVAESGGEPDSE